jgi:8-oxo-dGTP pyrophosphatase MutT (NUDIX family)
VDTNAGEPNAGASSPGSTSRPARRLRGLSEWHPDCYQRAVAYVTDLNGRLLVFDHLDVDAGTQVPGGGIHERESPEEAVLRELAEESGLDSTVVVRKLGEAWNWSTHVPAGLDEQIVHAFHLRVDRPPLREAWVWEERSGGDDVEHRFAFRWVSLDDAARLLWPHQAMWITQLRLSLARSAPTRPEA